MTEFVALEQAIDQLLAKWHQTTAVHSEIEAVRAAWSDEARARLRVSTVPSTN